MLNRTTSSTGHIVGRARSMRRHPTAAEGLLWLQLRGKQVNGFRFRRQEPTGPYIADFMCPVARLVVEIDGMSHEDAAADAARQRYIEERGFRVARYTNEEVLSDLEAVVQDIARLVGSPVPG